MISYNHLKWILIFQNLFSSSCGQNPICSATWEHGNAMIKHLINNHSDVSECPPVRRDARLPIWLQEWRDKVRTANMVHLSNHSFILAFRCSGWRNVVIGDLTLGISYLITAYLRRCQASHNNNWKFRTGLCRAWATGWWLSVSIWKICRRNAFEVRYLWKSAKT